MKIKNLHIVSAAALSLLLTFGAFAAETVKTKSIKKTPTKKTTTEKTMTHKKDVSGRTHYKKDEKTTVEKNNAAKTKEKHMQHKAKHNKHTPAHHKAAAHKTHPRTHASHNSGLGAGALAAGALGTGAVAGTYTGYKQPYSSTEIHKHYGPRNWNHDFPKGWNQGFVWATRSGKPVFGGYELPWWQQHYPEYYERSLKQEVHAASRK